MKLYVAVLDSLSNGAKMAQATHAVVELIEAPTEASRAWRRDSNTVVIVQLCKEKLESLSKVKGARSFREPDMGDALTAVAVVPTDEAAIKILKKAKLAS